MKEVKEECLDAASTGDHETLRKYLSFGQRFYVDPFNVKYNPLDLTIMYDHYRCVEVLLEYAKSHKGDRVLRGRTRRPRAHVGKPRYTANLQASTIYSIGNV